MSGRFTRYLLAKRGQSYWRSLYYFNLYRLVLGVAFVTIGITEGNFANLGGRFPSLFFSASLALVIVAVVSLITITRGRPAFGIQAYIQFSFDIILITLLGAASGGITSGLHLLVLVSVAAAGVVVPGYMSFFFPALGTLLALIEHSVSLAAYPVSGGSYTQVGLLGIALFSTSFIVNLISTRLEQAEEVAQKSASDLYRLSKLNEMVVARLDTGIMVVDPAGNLKLTNQRAQSLLNIDNASNLRDVSALLQQKLLDWQKNNLDEQFIKLDQNGPNIALRMTPVSDQTDANVAIFLEDLSQTEQHAHQLKLAALGRLTSAVAHEIRNPLGAISHAGQLINESEDLNPGDRRLVSIVNDQSERLNQIIKSILKLGRPHLREPATINLDKWLLKFRNDFLQTHDCDAHNLDVQPTHLEISADPDHMHQILTNLCENALRHGRQFNGNKTTVWITGGRTEHRQRAFLDIRNEGPSIPNDLRDKIFEPFFTTEGEGTGLGLYLAKELCQDNDARLDYVKLDNGNCFRIQFRNQSR